MKNLKLKFISFVATLALAASTFGAAATYNPTSAGITSVVSNRALALSSVIFANSATSAVTVALFNAPTNVLTYVIGAYTNSVITTGTTVVSYTNVFGNVNSTTNQTMTTTLTPVSASTNNYDKLLTYVIPASSTVSLPLLPSLVFQNGLAITNSATNIILTLQYQPAR